MNEVGPQTEKQLIFSVDGAVPAGALCALMGPSGSGELYFGRGGVVILLVLNMVYIC